MVREGTNTKLSLTKGQPRALSLRGILNYARLLQKPMTWVFPHEIVDERPTSSYGQPVHLGQYQLVLLIKPWEWSDLARGVVAVILVC